MQKFFEALANVFRIPDLRKRVLFTLGILAVYRVGAYIPTPGIDTNRFQDYFTRNAAGGFLGYFDLFSGGMLRRMTIFALGITPYITSSIILQLLTVVIPTLDKLQKEGELGRRKITQWTRYLTVALAIVQSVGIAFALQNSDGNFVLNPGLRFHLYDDSDLYGRVGIHHVAWRADHRSRDWQRYVADHLCRYHCRAAARHWEYLHQYFRHAPVACAADDDHHRFDGGGGGVYCAGRAR